MIHAMSESDNALPGFFYAPESQDAAFPATGQDDTATAEPAAWTTPPATAEPAAWTTPPEPAEPAASTEPTEPAASTAPVVEEAGSAPSPPSPSASSDAAAISGSVATGPLADNDEGFSVVNPDGSTTTRLPDGSYRTVVTLPGGAEIVTSTQPPGAAPTPAAADQPRGRRWRKGNK
jgi:hypothetical protein